MLRCPRCGELLVRRPVHGTELDGCRACGGAFFDAGELTTLARDPAQLLDVDRTFSHTQVALTPNSTNRCPKCLATMVKFEQASLPGIELDACPTCRGIWLDGGEATEIAKRRGATVPPPSAPKTPDLPRPPLERSGPRVAGPPRQGLIALGLTVSAFLVASGVSVRRLSGGRSRGQVLEIGKEGAGRRSPRFAYIQFSAQGRTIVIRRNLWAFDLVQAGEDVEVLYSTESPEDASLGTFWHLWGIPLFILMIGTLISVRALGYMVQLPR